MSQNIKIGTHAIVHTKDIGPGTSIADFSYIAENVTLGANVVIHPQVTIYSGVNIGDGVEVFPGTIIGKVPKGAGALARSPSYSPIINIGNDCSVGPNAVIYYDVVIGNNTLLGDGASIREQCSIGNHCLISRYVTVNYNTTIGDRTKIMDMTHITGNCTIGSNVFISTGIKTVNDNALGRSGYIEEGILGPIVEDGAAIGAGAILLSGITIGSNATVGAGSVVTKSVMADTLVMGVPARFVRSFKGKAVL